MNNPARFEATEGAQAYRVTAEDYCRMIAAGGFADAHVELVDGELIEMAPAGIEHSGTHGDLVIDLGVHYRPLGYRVLVDAILQISDVTVRAPDISVIDQATGDRNVLCAADVLLAVEIAQTTLPQDLGSKRTDYASAGIRHYWVVDVEGRRTHCHADPQGSDYAAIEVIAFGEPMAVPEAAGTIVVS